LETIEHIIDAREGAAPLSSKSGAVVFLIRTAVSRTNGADSNILVMAYRNTRKILMIPWRRAIGGRTAKLAKRLSAKQFRRPAL